MVPPHDCGAALATARRAAHCGIVAARSPKITRQMLTLPQDPASGQSMLTADSRDATVFGGGDGGPKINKQEFFDVRFRARPIRPE